MCKVTQNLFLAWLFLTAVAACQFDKSEPQLVQPEYDDWYVIKAPDERAIEAAYGDIDGTLLIATGSEIHLTKDRGKTWLTTNYNDNAGIYGFMANQDTLLVLISQFGSVLDSATSFAATPYKYSLDQGNSWKLYLDKRPSFTLKTARNRVNTTSLTEYSIDILLTTTIIPGSPEYVETVGIKTSTGYQFKLPNDHVINSLYLDSKSRLYVSCSAPVCGQRDRLAYCGSSNGILYVSKKPQR